MTPEQLATLERIKGLLDTASASPADAIALYEALRNAAPWMVEAIKYEGLSFAVLQSAPQPPPTNHWPDSQTWFEHYRAWWRKRLLPRKSAEEG